LAKPAGPPLPSPERVYPLGGSISESFTRPENLAEIWPSLNAATAVISFSDVASRLSHPGMQALRISGSFSALHTVFCGAEIRRSPAISMVRQIRRMRPEDYKIGGLRARRRLQFSRVGPRPDRAPR